jgi:hypothetical protein
MGGAPKFHPLSFGGWKDYQEWADHGFVPRPLDDDPADEPVDDAEPDTATSETPGTPDEPGDAANDQGEDLPVGDFPDNSGQATVILAENHDVPADTDDPDLHWPDEQEAEDRELKASPARPYVRTRGRTRAVHDLRIETMVSVTHLAVSRYGGMTPDHQQICDLCWTPKSVAEVAAHIDAPIGVARILISDAISLQVLMVHEVNGNGPPSVGLMQRVLDGLRRL